ncbi:ornithine carbamoyltransferase [Anoxybacter fermentans]|uniref:Ornithine carbamoyltransferase n=1 Tax=Anoxybacter fermentans TaxID=1323375 RepID=A0A3S9SUN7_9FIRM|nr:ornithine carbamoyltransferase [Anoxybacter fermentans]AZR72006.1 ornithine carbamoyltransferase [Anoxybacter fermentans]
MAVNLKGKHLLTIHDWSVEEVWQVLKTAEQLKLEEKRGQKHELLAGKTLGMIFQKPSLRTRVSFEVGMTKLGGHAVYLGPDDIKLGKRETTEDIAKVLSRYVDGIMARVFDHKDVEELAKYATVPVINGLSDFSHPCQAFADIFTVYEKKRTFKGLKMAFIGDGNNVANSLMFACAKVGMDFVIASPKNYWPKEEVVKMAREDAKATGATIEIVEDPKEAAKDADVVYTDVWTSMGQEAEYEERVKVFKPYQVNLELLELAKPDCIVLHCLPAHYGEEITLDVARDPRGQSIYDQAENRMHVEMAIMAMVMG